MKFVVHCDLESHDRNYSMGWASPTGGTVTAGAANAALKTEQEQIRKEIETRFAWMSDKDKQALDRQLGQKMEQKRQELLNPIVDSIIAMLKSVAAEKELAKLSGK